MATYNTSIGRTETGEGTGSLIPDAERREILQDLPSSSAVLQLARKINMSTKIERQPVLSSFPAAYWVTGDTGLKQTTKQEWEDKFITAEELAVIVPIPDTVVADAAYDLWAEVRPRLVEALGAKLDEAVLFGTDAPASWEPSIVEGATAAGNVVAPGTVVSESGVGDIAQDVSGDYGLMAQVEADDYEVNGFVARRRVKSKLRGLRASTGEVIFQPSMQAGTPATLYGESIIYPTPNGTWDNDIDIIGGDWTKLVLGVRQDLTFKLFTEGVISDGSGNVVLNLMQQDSKALRVVCRYGYTVANPVTVNQPSTTDRYPFAVLESQGS